MQQAYATSESALRLMADAQTLMGLARAQGPGLPEPGNISAMDLCDHDSLDVLAAPRECAININGQQRTVNLNPASGSSIGQICAAALKTAPPEPQAPAPINAPGMGQKK
ncbi:MAG: hypothetical protein HYS17_05735 [Micavibrio aeruginosavorus]|uniref:Uncharacterized protein n=1 Tax=Micavibrio aeruginosavorus TaxID=349221 RepID=A0A7T5UHT9_9BACT|nr:MAG: hypothetical protein HYS17_05735 [Micavibrio aeruginosavorus]